MKNPHKKRTRFSGKCFNFITLEDKKSLYSGYTNIIGFTFNWSDSCIWNTFPITMMLLQCHSKNLAIFITISVNECILFFLVLNRKGGWEFLLCVGYVNLRLLQLNMIYNFPLFYFLYFWWELEKRNFWSYFLYK